MDALDPKQCYAAIQSHDPRFDGLFFVAVASTGIYCRPICRVRTPRFEHCSFYANAASAEQAGYRPCLRCRPELAPGNSRADAVKRIAHVAAERIQAGALTNTSVDTLAAELGISTRQLNRAVRSEYGVSPLTLALTSRLLMAKQLLTDTDLKVIDVAFASGFSSLRRFNDAFQKRYRLSPSQLRRRKPAVGGSDVILLRLAYRPPLAWEALTSFLCTRGSSRLEQYHGERYLRSVRIDAATGWIAAEPDAANHQIRVEVSSSLLGQLIPLQTKLRRLFDLDASPALISAHLSQDETLAPLIKRMAGLRVPGTLDPFELSLRAILGQQVTVKAASTLFGRFVDRFGIPVETPLPGLDRCAPPAEALADAALQDIIDLGVTQRRAATIRELARALVEKRIVLDHGDRTTIMDQLLALPGIGPWTAHYIAMRALSDPNAFPAADLGLARALNLDKPAQLTRRAEGWQPWRAYGAMHLWHHLSSGG